MKKELRTMHIDDIRPYKRNPRRNDAAVDAVAESIMQCEYISPIITDENFEILAGHTRYKALQKLGRDEIEVVIVSGLTEEQKKKFRILDNKTNELADWDFDLLNLEMEDLDFGTFDFGLKFDTFALLDEAGYDSETVNAKDFSVTFVFDKQYEEAVKGYISTKGKTMLETLIIEECLGDKNNGS